jgi:hypothetical protein
MKKNQVTYGECNCIQFRIKCKSGVDLKPLLILRSPTSEFRLTKSDANFGVTINSDSINIDYNKLISHNIVKLDFCIKSNSYFIKFLHFLQIECWINSMLLEYNLRGNVRIWNSKKICALSINLKEHTVYKNIKSLE